MSGDATYEGMETLIAMGTRAGKILVFNVLGLLVQESLMEAPILALEWVGDMSMPSLLPARRASSAFAPRPSVLDTLYLESDSETESGTVRRSVSPTKPPNATNPLPPARGPDMFTTSPPERRMSAWSRKPSDISFGSPQPQSSERPRRKSYPRPRIATETFKSPPTPASPLLRSQTNPLSADPEPSRWSKTLLTPIRSPSRIPSPPILSPLAVEYSPSEYSQSEDDEPFFTPPTSKRVRSPVHRISRPSSISIEARGSPIQTKGGIMRVGSANKGKGRHVSFPTRSSPKPVDGEMDAGSLGQSYNVREETEKLRMEMRGLRREVELLREAMLERMR
jgi:hypothetical protein